MKVIAAKLTEDMYSSKIAYEKNNSVYIRTGRDGFKIGIPYEGAITSLFTKWGFRKVDNPPDLKSSQDIVDSMDKFQIRTDGVIQYYP